MGVLAMFDVSAKVAQNDQNKDRVKKAKTLGIVCIVLSIIGCIAVNVAYYRNKGDDSSDSSKKQKAVKFAGIGGGVVIFVAAFVCGAMALAESGKLKKDFPKSPIVAAATA
jgi:Na+/proline symporter